MAHAGPLVDNGPGIWLRIRHRIDEGWGRRDGKTAHGGRQGDGDGNSRVKVVLSYWKYNSVRDQVQRVLFPHCSLPHNQTGK